MQRLGGLLLMLAGVSLGAYTFLPPPSDGEENLRAVTRISAAPDRAAATSEVTSGTSAAAHAATVNAATAQQAVAASPIETAAISKPSTTWSAIVTAEAAQQGRMTSSKPGDGETRAQLTRDLQSELKRVGCYGGDVTGNWTPSTKRAMGAFMDRVNATLPIEEPDYILLTLVQGHSAQACGAACPSGQTASGDGRCMPHAVMAARSAKKAPAAQEQRVAQDDRRAEERLAAERVASQRADNDRRMAEEARKVAAADKLKSDQLKSEQQKLAAARRLAEQRRLATAAKATAQAAPVKSIGDSLADATAIPKNIAVAEAGKERLPWQQDDDLTAPAPRRAVRPDGMMAIGGPQMAKADLPGTAEPVSPSGGPGTMPAVGTEIDAAPREVTLEPMDPAIPVVRQVMRPPVTNALPRQGAVGTKSGPAVQRGLPGGKSGVAGLRPQRPQKKAFGNFTPGARPLQNRKSFAARRAPLPPSAYVKASKPKFYYFANGNKVRRDQPRPGSPSYNMLQAMGGIF
ncbi:MAG: hypothetical protein ABL907_02845 [Hyphomicrobium sp.]